MLVRLIMPVRGYNNKAVPMSPISLNERSSNKLDKLMRSASGDKREKSLIPLI